MQLSQQIVCLSALTLFLVTWQRRRADDRRNASSSRLPLEGWQKLFGVIAFVLVVLMMINPDFLAFGFLMDAAYFDLLVLLLSLQLQSYAASSWRLVLVAFGKALSFVICALKRSAFRTSFFTVYACTEIVEWACAIYAVVRRTFTRNGPSVISL